MPPAPTRRKRAQLALLPTSGPLEYADAKGMHITTAPWWIDTGIRKWSFQLKPYGDLAPSSMNTDGQLTVQKGYIWDGSSGPTIDGDADPVPSLVHDVLYEAIRAGRAPSSLRGKFDSLYYRLLRERGMGRMRAGARYVGLRLVGWTATRRSRGPQYPARKAR